MNTLLIGGAPSTGKTMSLVFIGNYLLSKGFRCTSINTIPANEEIKDYKAVLEGKNSDNKNIRIIINSASDTKEIIDSFNDFYNSNGVYDILISSIRDIYQERDYLLDTLQINSRSDAIIEIPLAKITRRNDYSSAQNWYKTITQNLIIKILSSSSFKIP